MAILSGQFVSQHLDSIHETVGTAPATDNSDLLYLE